MTSADHKEELQKSECHIPPKQMTAEKSGCVTKCVGSQMPKRSGKHGSYRKNGYDTIVADPDKKKIYNRTFADASKFSAPGDREETPWGTNKDKVLRSDPSQQNGSWEIGNSGFPINFTRAHTPYNHDFHHIMPMDCILSGLDGAHVKLLMEAEYNLNDGRNLIILPRGEYFARMVGLPYHASNHPKYIADIKKEMDKLNMSMRTASAIHKQQKVNTAKDALMDWEDLMFKELCTLGGKELHANKRAPDVDDIQIPSLGV